MCMHVNSRTINHVASKKKYTKQINARVFFIFINIFSRHLLERLTELDDGIEPPPSGLRARGWVAFVKNFWEVDCHVFKTHHGRDLVVVAVVPSVG